MAEGGGESGASEAISPFTLTRFFPDAQGLLDASYSTLEAIKETCFVALDANVLLLPYKLESVSLPDVIAAYEPLVKAERLIIPAQAVREFARHRSTKVAEIVKHLRDESSFGGPRLGKKIGALIGHKSYDDTKALATEVATKVKELQIAIKALADEVAANVGEDPVSIAYRNIFSGVVRENPKDCEDEKGFLEELSLRFKTKRPPGYKDGKKPDAGAGDLIIWKTILAEGSARKKDCIFVTADEKADWYVQSSGPFQPRLELLEEYRACSGKTLHIIPLSRLLHLFEAPQLAVEDVQRAESNDARESANQVGEFLALYGTHRPQNDIEAELISIDFQLSRIAESLRSMPTPTGNLSLPWERAWASQQLAAQELTARKAELMEKLRNERTDHLDPSQ